MAGITDLLAEATALEVEARRLDNEAEALMERAQEDRQKAALLRGRWENENDPLAYVAPAKDPALRKAEADPLFPAAADAVESLTGEYAPAEVGVLLGIVDRARCDLLVRGLADLGKVRRSGDGWKTVRFGEGAARDYIVECRTGTDEDIARAAEVPVTEAQEMLDRFTASGWLEWDESGRWHYLEPEGENNARPNRRPPEKDPPAYGDARATGMPVRIVDHGKRANATGRHRGKLRDAAYERQQAAIQARADEQRRKAKQ